MSFVGSKAMGTASWSAAALAVALLVNWFGDSLDGTLARVRDRQRPRYGYYVDHVIDLAGTAALFAGMGASGLMEPSIALAALAFVGAGQHAAERVQSLSYGHQRLVEIARALAGNPALLLLDEPGAGLNHLDKQELVGLLKRLKGHGLSIFIIDHDMNLVEQVADHITVLNFGRRIADGAPAEVLRNPDVIAAYLGEVQDRVPA